MTIEQANEIRNLLNIRDNLISKLKNFESCSSITGNINEGANGLGFRWDKDSLELSCLKDGFKKSIEKIDKLVSEIHIKEGAK